MARIKDLKVIEIFDNRGMPALAVTIFLDDGTVASSSLATGINPYSMPFNDLRDNINKPISDAVTELQSLINNQIKKLLIGLEANNQQIADKMLIDLILALPNKRITNPSFTAVSMAIAKAAALSNNLPLYKQLQLITKTTSFTMPVPAFTIIDGGKNANNNIDFQEIIILPATNKSLHESYNLGISIHNNIRNILIKENILPFTGEKGGLSPLLSSNEEAFSLLAQAAEALNIRLGYDAYLGADINAQSFYKDKHYKLKDKSIPMNQNEIINFYAQLSEAFHILYLEDPFSQDDTEGWVRLYSMMDSNTLIAADNFISCDPVLLQAAIEKKQINSLVIKPADISTITQAAAISVMAHAAGLKIIISDKTNDTNDTFLADFAIAVQADYVRFGAPVKGERVAKYNRLLEINEELNAG